VSGYRRIAGCVAGLAVLVLASGDLEAQALETTAYLGMGPETNGFSAALGARVDVVGVALGGYIRAGLRGATNVCETSLPPVCSYPEGASYEFAAGLTFPAEGERWLLLMGAGGGVLSWQDGLDPFVDVTLEARRRLNGSLSLVLGVDAIYAPSVERRRNGNEAIVPKRSVFLPVVLAGIALGL
jgi:hypothetical protein